MAGILSKVKKGQMAYRVLFFLPYIVMSVVVAKMWSLIFNPFSGIATVLAKFGIQAPLFLGDPDIALYSVAFVDASRYWIFLMIMFLTAFFQLDKSLEEAAKIDGANRVQNFFYVLIPQIRPTLVTIISLTFIWSFTAFDFVFLMTGGGPGNATELVSTYMYRLAMSSQQPGYASAIALVMVLFSAGYLLLMNLLRKRGWEI
jgi:ABC-type sugar transport systems, permease components